MVWPVFALVVSTSLCEHDGMACVDFARDAHQRLLDIRHLHVYYAVTIPRPSGTSPPDRRDWAWWSHFLQSSRGPIDVQATVSKDTEGPKTSAKFGPSSTKCGPKSRALDQRRPDIGKIWPKIGSSSTKFDRHSPSNGSICLKVDQVCQQTVVQIWVYERPSVRTSAPPPRRLHSVRLASN